MMETTIKKITGFFLSDPGFWLTAPYPVNRRENNSPFEEASKKIKKRSALTPVLEKQRRNLSVKRKRSTASKKRSTFFRR